MTLAPSWAAHWERVRTEPYRQSGRQAKPRGHVWVVEEQRAGRWRPLLGCWFVSRREAWARWTLERLRAAVVSYRCRDSKDRRRWGPWRYRRKHGRLRLAKYVPGRQGVFVVEERRSDGWMPSGVWSGATYRTRDAAQASIEESAGMYGRRWALEYDRAQRRLVRRFRVRSYGRVG